MPLVISLPQLVIDFGFEIPYYGSTTIKDPSSF
jgi:hypothetical protein